MQAQCPLHHLLWDGYIKNRYNKVHILSTKGQLGRIETSMKHDITYIIYIAGT